MESNHPIDRDTLRTDFFLVVNFLLYIVCSNLQRCTKIPTYKSDYLIQANQGLKQSKGSWVACVIRLGALLPQRPSRHCCYCHLQQCNHQHPFTKKRKTPSFFYMFTFYNLRFLLLTFIMASSARLRRTFQYPNDSDSDSPEAMDEQGINNLPILPSSRLIK